ncbi:hypothetical protein [Psychromicrobium xiongbiense]|uniref:hypothetical protein n=1 Tax=Psychromicrobium xiongbiense TaxID=3051184 RepID=UPI002556CA2F|nr:hypothetical protein [Psychromicrobium sp. YIM S02556]
MQQLEPTVRSIPLSVQIGAQMRGLVRLGLLESCPGDGTYMRSASKLEAVLRRRVAADLEERSTLHTRFHQTLMAELHRGLKPHVRHDGLQRPTDEDSLRQDHEAVVEALKNGMPRPGATR